SEGCGRGRGELLVNDLQVGLLRCDELTHADLGAGDDQQVARYVDDGLGLRPEIERTRVVSPRKRLGPFLGQRPSLRFLLQSVRQRCAERAEHQGKRPGDGRSAPSCVHRRHLLEADRITDRAQRGEWPRRPTGTRARALAEEALSSKAYPT